MKLLLINFFNIMKKYFRDFISTEQRDYKFKFGRTVASSLTGFVIGAVTTHIIWSAAFKQMYDIFAQ